MAEKFKDSSVSLNISSREAIPAVVYKLNIPNFFSLPEYDGTLFDSPTFEFANATWYFKFYSDKTWTKEDDTRENDCVTDFCVRLVRLNSEISEQTIFSRVAVLDANDEELEFDECSYFHASYFEEDGEESEEIAFFKNDVKPFDNLESLTLFIQIFHGRSTEVDADENMRRDFLKKKEEKEEEEESRKVCLRVLSNKTLSSVIWEVKIPNFFTLPEYDGTVFESDIFAFANAAWRFRFKSSRLWSIKDEDESEPTIKDFTAYLVRLDSEIPNQWIFQKITLLNENDELYSADSGGRSISDDFEEYFLSRFNNRKQYFDRSDSLTLIIHLFCDKSTKVAAGQLLNTTEEDAERLSQDFKKLLLNGKNRDFTLRVSDKEFLVHRDVLMARSPVFEAMFSHDMSEKNDGFIEVPDCDPKAMEQFLIYVYSGKVETLNEENVLGVYYTADKYNVPLLKEQCAEFIKKSLSTTIFCSVMQLALNHSDTDLLECATEYFLTNTRDILPTVEWMSFVKSNPIAANELFIKSYDKLYDAK